MLLAVLDHVHSPPFLHLLSDKEHLQDPDRSTYSLQ